MLGLVANAFDAGTARDALHALSTMGLVVAAALLAVRMARSGHGTAAGGFAIFAVAQTMMWATGGPSQGGAEATFATAVLFSAPGLVLVATSSALPSWARAAGAVAGALFAVHGARYLGGAEVSSEDGLVGAAYLALVIAASGWAWSVRPARGSRAARHTHTDPVTQP
ncbi:MAG TPA: hypothetical protein VGW11_02405 [Solirubrobacteraceae bacterium]|nr:hypothetical protein [Solirubrobacteraceae bacterium]